MCALVTGVQTCALPISFLLSAERVAVADRGQGGVPRSRRYRRPLRTRGPKSHRAAEAAFGDRAQAICETFPVPRLHPLQSLPARQVHLPIRSEEHTSELQSLMRISYAVFCLKKKTKNKTTLTHLSTSSSVLSKSPLRITNNELHK